MKISIFVNTPGNGRFAFPGWKTAGIIATTSSAYTQARRRDIARKEACSHKTKLLRSNVSSRASVLARDVAYYGAITGLKKMKKMRPRLGYIQPQSIGFI